MPRPNGRSFPNQKEEIVRLHLLESVLIIVRVSKGYSPRHKVSTSPLHNKYILTTHSALKSNSSLSYYQFILKVMRCKTNYVTRFSEVGIVAPQGPNDYGKV